MRNLTKAGTLDLFLPLFLSSLFLIPAHVIAESTKFDKLPLLERWKQIRGPGARDIQGDIRKTVKEMLETPGMALSHPEVIPYAIAFKGAYIDSLTHLYEIEKDENVREELATYFQKRGYHLGSIEKTLRKERKEGATSKARYRAAALMANMYSLVPEESLPYLDDLMSRTLEQISPRDQQVLLRNYVEHFPRRIVPTNLLEKIGLKLGQLNKDYGFYFDDPAHALHQTTHLLSEEEERLFFFAFQKGFNTPFDPKKTSCESACELAKTLGNWATKGILDKSDGFENHAWHYGNKALLYLFLAKASRYCVGVSSVLKTVKNIQPRPTPVALKTKEDADLDFTLTALRDSGTQLPAKVMESVKQMGENRSLSSPQSPLYFGDIFYEQYLNEIASRPELASNQAAIEKQKTTVGSAHQKLAEIPTTRFQHHFGSLPFYYLKAIALIHHPENAALAKQLQYALDGTGDPLLIPYDELWVENFKLGKKPDGEKLEDLRLESAPRAVTVNYALYLTDPESKETGKPLGKPQRLENVVTAIENFRKRGWYAAMQSVAAEYHSDSVNHLGSHLYYPNVAYIVSIADTLLQDPLISSDQKKRIETALHEKNGIMDQLKSRINSAGWIENDALNQAGSAPWKNAFAGLALLADCKDKQNHSYGILSKPLDGTSPPVAHAAGKKLPLVKAHLPAKRSSLQEREKEKVQ